MSKALRTNESALGAQHQPKPDVQEFFRVRKSEMLMDELRNGASPESAQEYLRQLRGLEKTLRDAGRAPAADEIASEAARWERKKALSFEQQVERARKSGGGYMVPSSRMSGVTYQVDPERETCTCPGFHQAKKYGHPCRHLKAVYHQIAHTVLDVRGFAPPAVMHAVVADAIAALEASNGAELRERYLCDGHNAVHYGYSPNHRGEVRYLIGLRPEARPRGLSAGQARAAAFVLRELLEMEARDA